jgi:hypothetical protein
METYTSESVSVHDVVKHTDKAGKLRYQGVVAIQGATMWLTKEHDEATQVDMFTRDQLISENDFQFRKFERVPMGEGVN